MVKSQEVVIISGTIFFTKSPPPSGNLEMGAKKKADYVEFMLTASLAENLLADAPGVLRPLGGPLHGRVPRGAESLEEHQVLPPGAHAEPDRMLARTIAVVLLTEHESEVAPQPLGHLALHHLEDPHGGKVHPVVRRGSNSGNIKLQ